MAAPGGCDVKVGYCRVSSTDQNADAQRQQLEAAGVDRIFEERVSGKNTTDRAELRAILDFVHEAIADRGRELKLDGGTIRFVPALTGDQLAVAGRLTGGPEACSRSKRHLARPPGESHASQERPPFIFY
jgi:hypothetical protein